MSEQAGTRRLVAYADESRFNKGRYRSISVVSLSESNAPEFKEAIQARLVESRISELKWQHLDGAKERFAARKVVEFLLEKARQGHMRADVLIWDTHDRRHIVRRRDDIANLQRMHYHLLKNVLRQRWPDGSVWTIFPDEHTSLDWKRVEDFLGLVSTETEIVNNPSTKGRFSIRLRKEFLIEEIRPCQSHMEPLVQMADLLAGLAAYSFEKYASYERWQKLNNPQKSLFPIERDSSPALSCADRERCKLLCDLDQVFKQRKMGVSLKSNRGLRTLDPHNPVNFWTYVPQHAEDKAPVKFQR